jgi:hypothetical protein
VNLALVICTRTGPDHLLAKLAGFAVGTWKGVTRSWRDPEMPD